MLKEFKKWKTTGQTGMTLIYVLVFMVITIVVLSASVIVGVISSQSTLKFDLGNQALSVAESGAENALIRMLRDLNYSGETLSVGDGSAAISVSSGVVTSVGKVNNFSRTVVVITSYNNSVLSILSWREN